MMRFVRFRHSARNVKVPSFGVCAVLFFGPVVVPFPAFAGSAEFAVERNQAVLDFPNTATFQLTISGPAEIERIVLEYGVDQMTCGDVVGKALPDFSPGTRVETEWTWDMRQSGSEPPGARIWWQWRVTDAEGGEQIIQKSEIVWLDSEYPWKQVATDSITVHWYAGGPEFGADMLASATESIRNIQELIDLNPDGMIHLYLYADYEDMRDSILYEPGWTGGQSYGAYNIIILGVPEGYEDWAKHAIAHELMHNVVDRFTFSCLVRIPTWVHEGLAMVSQGGPEEDAMARLQDAIGDDTLFPLRSLGGGFPEDADAAELAYTQSFSVVDFLIRRGEASRMRSLLGLLAEGTTMDDALQNFYGFNVDGLDAAWRVSVGAAPLTQEDLAPTPTSTAVPTYQPLTINPKGGSAGPTGEFFRGWVEILIGLCVCGLCLLPIAGIGAAAVLGLARGRR